MGSKRIWPILVLTLVLGFAMGGLSIWAYMVGPGGYRPLSAARTTASGTPSASATSAPTPTGVTSPSPRSAASMGFHAATGKLVLFGGYVTRGSYHEFGDYVSDTWIWDGAHWSRPVLTSSPVERSEAVMAYDAVRRVVVLREGTETWGWDGARWVLMGPNQTPPAPGWNEPMCWDSDRGVVLLFSGAATPSFATSNGPLSQIWAWDGVNWNHFAAPDPAPEAPGNFPPSGGSMAHTGLAGVAYDTARKVAVYFGHAGGAPETWTFDGASWTKMATTTGSASTFFSMAADEARSDMVVFGENGDTWTWDGSKWTPRNPAHSPAPRRESSMAYDSTRHVVVLFGGYAGSAANLHEFNDTWTWNGSDWTEVVPPTPASNPLPAPPPTQPSPR